MDYSYNSSVSGGGAAVLSLLMLAFYVLVVIGLWKTFVKAGHPGWAAIIPFYNIYILVKIAGRPTWWFWVILAGSLLGWIPIVGWILLIAIWVMWLLLSLDVAKNFGQGTGFGILLWLFSGILFLVLGFGNYQYRQVAHPEMAGSGFAGGQYAAPPAPPAPPAGQPMAPPPPLARPLTAAPLAPPPSQVAPPAPPAQVAAPAPPPVAETPVAEAVEAEAAPAEAEVAEAVTEAAPAEAEVAEAVTEAAPAEAEAAAETAEEAVVEDLPPESPTPPPPPAS